MAVPPASAPAVRPSSSVRHNLRTAARQRLSWSLSHDLADFDRFYEDSYVPFVRAQFGARAMVRERAPLRRRFRHGGLMWIEQDGRRLLGQLVELRGDVLTLLVVGPAVPVEEVRRLGAFAASNLFGLELAQRLGASRLNLGLAPPSPTDALTLPKLGWGCTIGESPWIHHDLALAWDRPGPALEAFLAATPLIHRAGGRLAVLTAGIEPDGREHRRLRATAATAGLAGVALLAERGAPGTPVPARRVAA
jgi:hypothetical protein